jgi:hypothetical protein
VLNGRNDEPISGLRNRFLGFHANESLKSGHFIPQSRLDLGELSPSRPPSGSGRIDPRKGLEGRQTAIAGLVFFGRPPDQPTDEGASIHGGLDPHTHPE